MGMDQSRDLAALFGKYGITTNHTWRSRTVSHETRKKGLQRGLLLCDMAILGFHVQFQRFSLQAGMTV